MIARWLKKKYVYIYFAADKYCPILEVEGGLNDVQALLDDPKPYQRIKELAEMVITNYRQYKEPQQRNQNQPDRMYVVEPVE